MNPSEYSSQNIGSIIPVISDSVLPSTHESIYLVGINSNDVYKKIQKSKKESSVATDIINKTAIEGFESAYCSGDACFTQFANNINDISQNFVNLVKNENKILNNFTDLSNNIDSYNKDLNQYINEDSRTYFQRLLNKPPTVKEARRDDTEKLLEQEKIFYALGSITAVSLLIGSILIAKK